MYNSEIRVSLKNYESKLKELKILALCHGPIYPYPSCVQELFPFKPLVYSMDYDETSEVNSNYKGDIYNHQHMKYFPDKYFDIVLIESCTDMDYNYDVLLINILRILKLSGLLITPEYANKLGIGMLFKYCPNSIRKKFINKNKWMKRGDFFFNLEANYFTFDIFNCLMTLFGFKFSKQCKNNQFFYIYTIENGLRFNKNLIYNSTKSEIVEYIKEFYYSYIDVLPKE
jgi:hypothetical protein